MQTTLHVPFAHTIAPDNLGYLMDEVAPEVWDDMRDVFEFLATKPHQHGGGASFYAVFLAPYDRSNVRLMHADQLYARYVTEYYNEDIHLIYPKAPKE